MRSRTRSRGWLVVLLCLALGWIAAGTPATAAGPSASAAGQHGELGANVYVFTPSMSQDSIQQTVDSIADQQISNQFGTQRYALLFEPGTYGSAAHPLNFQVGYYTEVAGLGTSPTDVTINGSVDVHNQCFPTGDPNTTNCIALDNFWRSLSNLTINVAGQTGCRTGTEFWAVSQAAPMRRVKITGGNLSLMDYCTAGPQYSSGGFIADSDVTGSVTSGSQQQFLVRNSSIGGWSNGVWNQVFSGVEGAPAQAFGDPNGAGPYTTLDTSKVSAEEPFLVSDGPLASGGAHGRMGVFVPAAEHDTRGTSWASGRTRGHTIPLSRFLVASPSTPVSTINRALARGRNLLLTPGVYKLDQAIRVRRANTVVLGMGFATLVPQRGNEAMTVADVPGVKLSGLLFDAGPRNSRDLLRIGSPRGGLFRHGSAADPTRVQDVFFRIGGATPGRATTSLVVDSSHVVLDDIWAWRADHGTGVGWTQNTARTGVVVNGNDVTAYGLFVEHYQGYQVVWNGERGEDVFFQNEMPYDVPSQSAWNSGPHTKGYPAFEVSPWVRSFSGYGMGSYSYFDQGIDIHASQAFQVPKRPGVRMHDLLTVFLNGSGGIDSVVDGTGAAVSAANRGPAQVVRFP